MRSKSDKSLTESPKVSDTIVFFSGVGTEKIDKGRIGGGEEIFGGYVRKSFPCRNSREKSRKAKKNLRKVKKT